MQWLEWRAKSCPCTLSLTQGLPIGSAWRSTYNQYIFSTPKAHSYQFLHKFLLLSQHHHPPASHWVLKTPVHGYFFPELLKEFPDAHIVVTHRDPLNTLPSISMLMSLLFSFFLRDAQSEAMNAYICKETFGVDMVEFMKRILFPIEEAREREKEKGEKGRMFIDVEYADFLKDPMMTVKNIYQSVGLELSEEAEKKMLAYMEENKKERERDKERVTLTFSLGDFGIDKQYVMKEFAEYRKKRGYSQ